MKRDLSKTISFLVLHLLVGFTVAYLFTGSWVIAGGIALVEPLQKQLKLKKAKVVLTSVKSANPDSLQY